MVFIHQIPFSIHTFEGDVLGEGTVDEDSFASVLESTDDSNGRLKSVPFSEGKIGVDLAIVRLKRFLLIWPLVLQSNSVSVLI